MSAWSIIAKRCVGVKENSDAFWCMCFRISVPYCVYNHHNRFRLASWARDHTCEGPIICAEKFKSQAMVTFNNSSFARPCARSMFLEASRLIYMISGAAFMIRPRLSEWVTSCQTHRADERARLSSFPCQQSVLQIMYRSQATTLQTPKLSPFHRHRKAQSRSVENFQDKLKTSVDKSYMNFIGIWSTLQLIVRQVQNELVIPDFGTWIH